MKKISWYIAKRTVYMASNEKELVVKKGKKYKICEDYWGYGVACECCTTPFEHTWGYKKDVERDFISLKHNTKLGKLLY